LISCRNKLLHNDLPHLVALRKRGENYLDKKRQKLLADVCGPDGFDAWQPSQETWAGVDSI